MPSLKRAHTHTEVALNISGAERDWVRRKRGSCLLLLSPLRILLWWQHMTSPPFRPVEEETRRQSTRIETQRMSLAAAIAGCWYNMAAALVVTAALNLLNKRSIQWQQHWYHRGKIRLRGIKRRERIRRELHRQKMGTERERLRAKIQIVKRTLENYLAQNRDYTDYLSRG